MHLRGQGASWTDYIFFGGQRIAVNTGADLSTAKFLHADHLGSTRVCTDANGNATGQCAYEPFGEFTGGASACTIPIQYRFAGMEYDSETGLYHTWFRQYDPSRGRWTGVDPLAGHMDLPRSLNRYAYALNDPVNKVDPLGLDVFLFLWGCIWRAKVEIVGHSIGGQEPTYTVTITLLEAILCEDVGVGGGGGGGGRPPALKPPGLPGFTQQVYKDCAQQACGGTTGTIPGTDRSIPGYEAALAVFQELLLVGADPAVVGATLALESHSNLAVANSRRNRNGTVDVGPMQLNSGNANNPLFRLLATRLARTSSRTGPSMGISERISQLAQRTCETCDVLSCMSAQAEQHNVSEHLMLCYLR